MKQLTAVSSVRAWHESLKGLSLGFVPTMGALHAGHIALVERAGRECERVIVSIFVNPTQFNDPSDLEKYPRTLEADLEKLEKAGAHAVFLPEPKEIYRDNYRFELREKEFAEDLCGAARPGHFEGVLTVVMKLFQIVRPTRAYFGEKDYQQLRLIQDMAEAFFLPLEIVPCPTVREPDGLAMSSRNLRLSAAEREKAPRLYHALKTANSAAEARAKLEGEGFRVDYVEDRPQLGRRFAAAFLGQVRLIDNVEI